MIKGHPLPYPCRQTKFQAPSALRLRSNSPLKTLLAPFIVLAKFYHISIDHSIVIVQQFFKVSHVKDFPGSSDGKASAYNVGGLGSIPELGRSPGEGNSHPLQYSCLENPMDRGASQATVHGVAKSQTRKESQLSDFTFIQGVLSLLCLGSCK